MKKFLTIAAVTAISMATIGGAANAAPVLSATQFSHMIEQIHARQAEQRANINAKLNTTTVSRNTATVSRKGPSQEVLQLIRARQAQQRAQVATLVGH